MHLHNYYTLYRHIPNTVRAFETLDNGLVMCVLSTRKRTMKPNLLSYHPSNPLDVICVIGTFTIRKVKFTS